MKQNTGVAVYCTTMWSHISATSEQLTCDQVGDAVAKQYDALPEALRELFEVASKPLPADVIIGKP